MWQDANPRFLGWRRGRHSLEVRCLTGNEFFTGCDKPGSIACNLYPNYVLDEPHR